MLFGWLFFGSFVCQFWLLNFSSACCVDPVSSCRAGPPWWRSLLCCLFLSHWTRSFSPPTSSIHQTQTAAVSALRFFIYDSKRWTTTRTWWDSDRPRSTTRATAVCTYDTYLVSDIVGSWTSNSECGHTSPGIKLQKNNFEIETSSKFIFAAAWYFDCAYYVMSTGRKNGLMWRTHTTYSSTYLVRVSNGHVQETMCRKHNPYIRKT